MWDHYIHTYLTEHHYTGTAQRCVCVPLCVCDGRSHSRISLGRSYHSYVSGVLRCAAVATCAGGGGVRWESLTCIVRPVPLPCTFSLFFSRGSTQYIPCAGGPRRSAGGGCVVIGCAQGVSGNTDIYGPVYRGMEAAFFVHGRWLSRDSREGGGRSWVRELLGLLRLRLRCGTASRHAACRPAERGCSGRLGLMHTDSGRQTTFVRA